MLLFVNYDIMKLFSYLTIFIHLTSLSVYSNNIQWFSLLKMSIIFANFFLSFESWLFVIVVPHALQETHKQYFNDFFLDENKQFKTTLELVSATHILYWVPNIFWEEVFNLKKCIEKTHLGFMKHKLRYIAKC